MESITQLFPQLVTLRLGDLMRCMLKTSEEKVIAVYTKLITGHNPKLEILRVKNRLSMGTKDILINAKFRVGN